MKKTTNKEVKVDVEVETNKEVEEVKEVEKVEEVEVQDQPKIEVTENAIQKTDKLVRIKMRNDMLFWVNREMYDLKKGKTYSVPDSVKKRLNKAGALLPLN